MNVVTVGYIKMVVKEETSKYLGISLDKWKEAIVADELKEKTYVGRVIAENLKQVTGESPSTRLVFDLTWT